MTNFFYNPTGNPGTGTFGASAPIRAEFAAISEAFDLFPNLAGAPGRAIVVNPTGTALALTDGQLALGGNLTTFGNFTTTLTAGASVNLTLPLVDGTLMTFNGGTMVGPLTLAGPPSTALMAATKAYVDTTVSSTVAGYLPLTGGTLSGTVSISRFATIDGGTGGPAQLFLDTPVGGQHMIAARSGGLARWTIMPGDPSNESGTSTGADFVVSRYNNAGSFIDNPLTIARSDGLLVLRGDATAPLGAATKQYVDSAVTRAGGPFLPLTGGQISGNLGVTNSLTVASTAGVWAGLILSKSAPGLGNQIIGQTASSNRWTINPGDQTAESGGNAGSDFGIARYSDAGAYLGSPLTIQRSTGNVAIAQSLTVGVNLTVTGAATVNGLYLANSANLYGNASYTQLIMDSSNWSWVYNRADGSLWYQRGSDGAHLFQIDPAGNTSSASRSTAANFMSTQGAFYVANNNSYYFYRNSSTGNWGIVNNSNEQFTFDTSGYMTAHGGVVAGGSVSVDLAGSYQFYVAGDNSRNIKFSDQWLLQWDPNSGSITYFPPTGGAFFTARTSDRAWVNWGSGGTGGPFYGSSYNPISDERLKSDIEDAPVGLPEILAIQPIKFLRHGAGRSEIGFSAQQLRTVIPDAVMPVGTASNTGPGSLASDDPILAVNVDTVVAALVNGMKTLNARLAAVEGRP